MSARPEPAAAPPPSAGESPPPDGPPPRGNLARWAARLVFLTLLVLLVGVPAYNEFPHEVARWYQAAAIEQYYDGQTEAAIATLGRAMAWDAQEVEFYRQRAEWQGEVGRLDEALADTDRALKLDPDALDVYVVRSEIHQKLGQDAEAVADWQSLADGVEKRGGAVNQQILNAIAYARAVGGIELKQGLHEAEAAINLMAGDYLIAERGGLLLYKLQRPRAAVRLLDRAVAEIEGEQQRRRARLASGKQARAYLGELLDVSRFEQSIAEARAATAKSYYYRSLAHEAAGNKQQAEDDLRRSRTSGGKPDRLAEAVEKLKDESNLIKLSKQMQRNAMVIDTRGFLHYQLGNNDAALIDLTTAVDLAEATLALLRRSPTYAQHQSNMLTPAELRHEMQSFEEGVAVMRYHRALVYQKLGDTKKADGDLARVRELGFDPGPDLY